MQSRCSGDGQRWRPRTPCQPVPGSVLCLFLLQSVSSQTFRAMTEADIPAVAALLREELSKFSLVPTWTEDEVRHWLLPREDVVFSYVVGADNMVHDFVSFYSLVRAGPFPE